MEPVKATSHAPLDEHVTDERVRRAGPQPHEQQVEVGPVAFGDDLDAAVGEVLGVPGDPEVAGVLTHEGAVPDALHLPGDDHRDP